MIKCTRNIETRNTQTQVPAVEPDLALSKPALGVAHRLLPLGGRHGVAPTKTVNRTEPGVGDHGQEGMEAGPARGCSPQPPLPDGRTWAEPSSPSRSRSAPATPATSAPHCGRSTPPPARDPPTAHPAEILFHGDLLRRLRCRPVELRDNGHLLRMNILAEFDHFYLGRRGDPRIVRNVSFHKSRQVDGFSATCRLHVIYMLRKCGPRHANSTAKFGGLQFYVRQTLRRWLWRKHGRTQAQYEHYTDARLHGHYGLWPWPLHAAWTSK